MLNNNKNNNLVMNPFVFDDLGLNDLDLEIARYMFYPMQNCYDKYGNYVDDHGTYHDQDDELSYDCIIPNGHYWRDDWQWYLEAPTWYLDNIEEEQAEMLESIPEEAMQQYGYHNMNYLHQILPSLK